MEYRKVKIETINLSFSYEEKEDVLKDINLKIFENERISIIGENGSGKTTLLLCICGLLKFRGKVLIDGEDFKESLRRKIGFLFENPDDSLFMPRVYDDVAFGAKNYKIKGNLDEIVRNSLNRVGLKDFENKVSHHLSYGEKKRVSLASLLSYEPEIFLLDEPTLGLSPLARRKFMKLIKDLKGTIVIATHDVDFAIEISDRILFLKNGTIKREFQRSFRKDEIIKLFEEDSS
ncbi:MAG: ABC transporter ATP-binding protein [Candidatus Hydrothermales bacterium]